MLEEKQTLEDKQMLEEKQILEEKLTLEEKQILQQKQMQLRKQLQLLKQLQPQRLQLQQQAAGESVRQMKTHLKFNILKMSLSLSSARK